VSSDETPGIDSSTGAAFPHDLDYKALNQGPHPVVAPRLSAPALNWHVASWNRDGETLDDRHERLSKLICKIMTNIEKLQSDAPPERKCEYRVLSVNDRMFVESEKFSASMFDGNISRENGLWAWKKQQDRKNEFRYETALISVIWSGQLVKFYTQIHSEYITFTFWLPVFRLDVSEPARSEAAADGGFTYGGGVTCNGLQADLIRKHLAAVWMYVVAAAMPSQLDIFLEYLGITGSDVTRVSELRDKIESNSSQEHLFEKVWQSLSKDLLESQIGVNIEDDREELFRSFADFRSIILPSELPFCDRDQPAGKPTLPPALLREVFRPDDASALMVRLSRFFTRESAARSELTGSLFLDGRVAYVSSLGSRAGRRSGTTITRHEKIGRSTRFAMVAKPMTRWQLGRLVERLNTLGTYRLAALRDLPKLNVVSMSIRKIGNDVDKFLSDQLLNRKSLEERRNFLKDLRANLAYATNNIVGGISYRIERSRYYVARFWSTAEGLRIERVEGFQPYDEFVKRRFSGTWDRIDRLGYRLSRLQGRIDDFGNAQSTLEQSEQTRSQVDLLRSAERFAIFPIAYYGGTALTDFFKLVGLEPGQHGLASIALVAATYAIALVWKTASEEEKAEARGEKIGEFENKRNSEDKTNFMAVGILLFITALALFVVLPKEKELPGLHSNGDLPTEKAGPH
jgi:hypothetical protein